VRKAALARTCSEYASVAELRAACSSNPFLAFLCVCAQEPCT